MLIAMDHGNKQTKLVRSEPFISGLSESEVRPFGADVLKYGDKYYQISDQRIPYRRDKTEDDRFFILTLFGIAKEIEATGAYTPGIIRVQLAVGLPPAHYGAQSKKFIQYFSRRGVISFTYRSKPYSILIDDVACYPQSYAAAVSMLQTLTTVPLALVVDIGGYTLDYIQIKKGRSDLVSCDSLENGVIMLYNKISSKVRAAQDILISEEEIDTILKGQPVQGLQEVVKVVEQCAQEFVSDLLSALRERQMELRTIPVIFVGGGSILLKQHIEKSGKVAHPVFVEDIRANVKGYETLYRLSHSGRCQA